MDVAKLPVGKYYIGMMRGMYRVWQVNRKTYRDGKFSGMSGGHTADSYWDMSDAYEKMCELNGWPTKKHPENKPSKYYGIKIVRKYNDEELVIYVYAGKTDKELQDTIDYEKKPDDIVTVKTYS